VLRGSECAGAESPLETLEPADAGEDQRFCCEDDECSAIPPGAKCTGRLVRCGVESCSAVVDGELHRVTHAAAWEAARAVDELGLASEQGVQMFVPSPFGEPVFADPYCSWLMQHDQECPPPSGGGGSSNPNPGGGHSGDGDCALCVLKYGACFVGCAINLICQYQCIKKLQDCTAAKCD
jgi:hypothetical protein